MGLPIKPRITLSKTPKEWENIASRLKEISNKDIHGYVNREIQKITNRYISNPSDVPISSGEKNIQFTVHPHTYMVLKEISNKMDMPLHSIIEEFVILPLMLSKP